MPEIREDRKYTKDHEWALQEGDNVRIGITDYAQHELGDIVFVEVPEIGTKVEAGEPFGSIEAVKTVAELFAPIGGTISEVNTHVQDDSALMNTDCYDMGWLIAIKPDNPSDIDSLIDADAYQKLIAE